MTDPIIESILNSNDDERTSTSDTDHEIEEKRESLAILTTLGTEKDYIGVQMSLGDVKRLSPKDVERYYYRYRSTLGRQVTDGLINNVIKHASRMLCRFIPIDDGETLSNDISRDELVRRELSSVVGYMVLKGGRFVALASALSHVVNHVDFSPGDKATTPPDLAGQPTDT